jgi:hypothetical protein
MDFAHDQLLEGCEMRVLGILDTGREEARTGDSALAITFRAKRDPAQEPDSAEYSMNWVQFSVRSRLEAI